MPPTNQTKLEGEKAIFTCEAKAMPGNVTVRWFREGSPVREVASLETRVTIRKDGSLIINPVSADDSGQYLCEVSNGIGDPQSASAHLNVECKLKMRFCLLDVVYFMICFLFFHCRSSKGDVHTNRSIPSISFSRRCAMLHKIQSTVAICHMDKGQTATRAISNERHCYYE